MDGLRSAGGTVGPDVEDGLRSGNDDFSVGRAIPRLQEEKKAFQELGLHARLVQSLEDNERKEVSVSSRTDGHDEEDNVHGSYDEEALV